MVDFIRGDLLGALNQHPLVHKLMSEAYVPSGVPALSSLPRKQCSVCDEAFGTYMMRKVGECQHEFCINCIREWATMKINEGSIDIRCPQANCQHKISYNTLKSFFTPTGSYRPPEYAKLPLIFKRYDDNLLWSAIHLMPDVRSCPVCHAGALLPANGVACRSVECRDCAFKFCPDCMTTAHEGVQCNDVDKRSAKDAAALHEARLNEAWKKDNTRRCPQCTVHIQRFDGCSHMTCKSCKYEFCWLCSRKYQPGKHVANNATKCNCEGPLP